MPPRLDADPKFGRVKWATDVIILGLFWPTDAFESEDKKIAREIKEMRAPGNEHQNRFLEVLILLQDVATTIGRFQDLYDWKSLGTIMAGMDHDPKYQLKEIEWDTATKTDFKREIMFNTCSVTTFSDVDFRNALEIIGFKVMDITNAIKREDLFFADDVQERTDELSYARGLWTVYKTLFKKHYDVLNAWFDVKKTSSNAGVYSPAAAEALVGFKRLFVSAYKDEFYEHFPEFFCLVINEGSNMNPKGDSAYTFVKETFENTRAAADAIQPVYGGAYSLKDYNARLDDVSVNKIAKSADEIFVPVLKIEYLPLCIRMHRVSADLIIDQWKLMQQNCVTTLTSEFPDKISASTLDRSDLEEIKPESHTAVMAYLHNILKTKDDKARTLRLPNYFQGFTDLRAFSSLWSLPKKVFVKSERATGGAASTTKMLEALKSASNRQSQAARGGTGGADELRRQEEASGGASRAQRTTQDQGLPPPAQRRGTDAGRSTQDASMSAGGSGGGIQSGASRAAVATVERRGGGGSALDALRSLEEASGNSGSKAPRRGTDASGGGSAMHALRRQEEAAGNSGRKSAGRTTHDSAAQLPSTAPRSGIGASGGGRGNLAALQSLQAASMSSGGGSRRTLESARHLATPVPQTDGSARGSGHKRNAAAAALGESGDETVTKSGRARVPAANAVETVKLDDLLKIFHWFAYERWPIKTWKYDAIKAELTSTFPTSEVLWGKNIGDKEWSPICNVSTLDCIQSKTLNVFNMPLKSLNMGNDKQISFKFSDEPESMARILVFIKTKKDMQTLKREVLLFEGTPPKPYQASEKFYVGDWVQLIDSPVKAPLVRPDAEDGDWSDTEKQRVKPPKKDKASKGASARGGNDEVKSTRDSKRQDVILAFMSNHNELYDVVASVVQNGGEIPDETMKQIKSIARAEAKNIRISSVPPEIALNSADLCYQLITCLTSPNVKSKKNYPYPFTLGGVCKITNLKDVHPHFFESARTEGILTKILPRLMNLDDVKALFRLSNDRLNAIRDNRPFQLFSSFAYKHYHHMFIALRLIRTRITTEFKYIWGRNVINQQIQRVCEISDNLLETEKDNLKNGITTFIEDLMGDSKAYMAAFADMEDKSFCKCQKAFADLAEYTHDDGTPSTPTLCEWTDSMYDIRVNQKKKEGRTKCGPSKKIVLSPEHKQMDDDEIAKAMEHVMVNGEIADGAYVDEGQEEAEDDESDGQDDDYDDE